jgi:hypothetical protein
MHRNDPYGTMAHLFGEDVSRPTMPHGAIPLQAFMTHGAPQAPQQQKKPAAAAAAKPPVVPKGAADGAKHAAQMLLPQVTNSNKGKAAGAAGPVVKLEPGVAPAGKKPAPKKNKEQNRMFSTSVRRGLATSTVLRVGANELNDPNNELVKHLRVNPGYTPVPHASAQKVNEDPKKRLWVLTFTWAADGTRTDFMFLKCEIDNKGYLVPHPEKAPTGERASVTQDVDTTKKLFLVKNIDAKGNYVANHFSTVHKRSTLIVSPMLIFSTDL